MEGNRKINVTAIVLIVDFNTEVTELIILVITSIVEKLLLYLDSIILLKKKIMVRMLFII